MLRNVSNQSIELMWGGMTVFMNPGDCRDMALFGAAGKTVVALEDRFVSKFAGKIEKFTPQEASVPTQEEIMPETGENGAETGTVEPIAHKKPVGRPKKR